MDEIDRKIVLLLAQDARVSVTHIARKVGRSRVAVQNRLDHLLESGEIAGFSISFKRKPFAAILEIRLGPKCQCDDVLSKVKSRFHINGAWAVAGGTDLFIWTEAERGDAVQQLRCYIAGMTEVEKVSIHAVVKTYE
jgi:DNA-binding Lrp family transcriptional regulator